MTEEDNDLQRRGNVINSELAERFKLAKQKPYTEDAAAKVAELLSQKSSHQAAETRIADELWELAAGYVEKDKRTAAPAMLALVTVTAQFWLGLWNAINPLETGSMERLDNLRQVTLKHLEMVRQIVASKSPDATAELFGLIVQKKEGPSEK